MDLNFLSKNIARSVSDFLCAADVPFMFKGRHDTGDNFMVLEEYLTDDNRKQLEKFIILDLRRKP